MPTVHEALERAIALHKQGPSQEAEQLYRQVLAVDPANVDALHLLGVLRHQTGNNEAAVALISQAIRLQGAVAALHNNLGEAYRELEQFPAAVASYQQAIRLQPNFPEAINNLGTVHQRHGRLDEALGCYNRAIELQPDHVNAHYNRGRVLLMLGQFEAGWREYEWRWQRPDYAGMRLDQPEWDGSPLAGRTLLVRAEQGLGDTLQFVRYAPLLWPHDGQVVVVVQSQLVPLLSQSGVPGLVAKEDVDEFDVHLSLMSLPRLFKATVDTIPAAIPYLSSRPESIDAWRATLGAHDSFRVGIQWQVRHKSTQPWRAIPLAAFEPLARQPGVRLFSLQKGVGSEEAADMGDRFPLVDLAPQLDNSQAFVDTAAVMHSLDLVITSDTSIAHLAGALGRPVWVALPFAADWRWMTGRHDSPWYPTMRLFRQSRDGVWSDVFEELADALRSLVHQKK